MFTPAVETQLTDQLRATQQIDRERARALATLRAQIPELQRLRAELLARLLATPVPRRGYRSRTKVMGPRNGRARHGRYSQQRQVRERRLADPVIHLFAGGSGRRRRWRGERAAGGWEIHMDALRWLDAQPRGDRACDLLRGILADLLVTLRALARHAGLGVFGVGADLPLEPAEGGERGTAGAYARLRFALRRLLGTAPFTTPDPALGRAMGRGLRALDWLVQNVAGQRALGELWLAQQHAIGAARHAYISKRAITQTETTQTITQSMSTLLEVPVVEPENRNRRIVVWNFDLSTAEQERLAARKRAELAAFAAWRQREAGHG